jgi:limonene-1,2-epoxide hydrolase
MTGRIAGVQGGRHSAFSSQATTEDRSHAHAPELLGNVGRIRRKNGSSMDGQQQNQRRIEAFWSCLYSRDWEQLAGFFGPDSEYTDVCSPPDDVAVGPKQIIDRLRLGLDGLSGYDHNLRQMVANERTVVTEHTETWHWASGETVTLPFVSVQDLSDGVIVRWWDYWDLATLMNAAPATWIEHIAQGYL